MRHCPTTKLAAKQKQIEDILKRAQAGEDFAVLATQYSEDPGSKDKGGELPPFRRGQMVPEFEAAAFSMTDKPDQRRGHHAIMASTSSN